MTINKLIHQAFERDKESVDFFIEVSDLYSELGNIDKAVGLKEELLKLPLEPSKKEEIMFGLAKDFHRAGMYDNALSVLEEVFLISDKKDEILDLQSHIHAELKEWKKVLDAQKKKKQKNPDFILYALCNLSKEVLLSGDKKRALLLLKEAELISKDHPHLLLHWLDIYLTEDRLDEIMLIGKKLDESHPSFFGLFLEKFLSYRSELNKDMIELVILHLRKNPEDYYTVFLFANYLFSLQKYREVLKILKGVGLKDLKIPALIRLYMETVTILDVGIDKSYYRAVINNIPERTRWFRCSNCGQEAEIYSFNCIRCSSINSLKPLWQK